MQNAGYCFGDFVGVDSTNDVKDGPKAPARDPTDFHQKDDLVAKGRHRGSENNS